MSPSYVLVRSYEGRNLTLHHADFYRINPPEETQQQDAEFHDLASLGLEDYLEDPKAVILIEWADNFPQWMEAPFWVVEVCGCGDQPRFIHVRKVCA